MQEVETCMYRQEFRHMCRATEGLQDGGNLEANPSK